MLKRILRHFRSRTRVVVLPVSPEIDLASPKFRETARAWLDNPITKVMLATAEYRCRPQVFTLPGDETKRLHILQGWELYRNTLLSLDSIEDSAKEPTESFVDVNHFHD